MKQPEVFKKIIGERINNKFSYNKEFLFSPINIGLCKYWGKKDLDLNIPMKSSISVTIPNKGSKTRISEIENENDIVIFNNDMIDRNSYFYKRLIKFVNFFRNKAVRFKFEIFSNIPTSCGFSSSSSGFSSICLAFDRVYRWKLTKSELSILSRIASGSSCRSFWSGFVKWNAGLDRLGMDSLGSQIDVIWEDFCVGIINISTKEKIINSKELMILSKAISPYFNKFIDYTDYCLKTIESAIINKDIDLLGKIVEYNSIALHCVIDTTLPNVLGTNRNLTKNVILKIVSLRENKKIPVYFTQEAGENIFIIFQKKNKHLIKETFKNIECIEIFN